MGDQHVLCVDHFVSPESLQSPHGNEVSRSPGQGSCCHTTNPSTSTVDIEEVEEQSVEDETEPLIQSLECRICQEDDNLKDLETPCACSGSLKYAHRKCVQRWCNEKGDITCEICHQPYQPGYTAPPRLAHNEDTIIDINGGWTISGTPMDLHDPRLLAIAAADRHFLESDYDDYADTSASSAAFCRSAALILMALLLLRHALIVGNGDEDDETSTFFSLFLLRAASFLLPCYIMAWAISILQRRRQREEAPAMAAAEVAYMIQAGQHRALQFTIASGPTIAPGLSVTPRNADATTDSANPRHDMPLQ